MKALNKSFISIPICNININNPTDANIMRIITDCASKYVGKHRVSISLSRGYEINNIDCKSNHLPASFIVKIIAYNYIAVKIAKNIRRSLGLNKITLITPGTNTSYFETYLTGDIKNLANQWNTVANKVQEECALFVSAVIHNKTENTIKIFGYGPQNANNDIELLTLWLKSVGYISFNLGEDYKCNKVTFNPVDVFVYE